MLTDFATMLVQSYLDGSADADRNAGWHFYNAGRLHGLVFVHLPTLLHTVGTWWQDISTRQIGKITGVTNVTHGSIYSSVSVSLASVTMSEQAQYQAPETEATGFIWLFRHCIFAVTCQNVFCKERKFIHGVAHTHVGLTNIQI